MRDPPPVQTPQTRLPTPGAVPAIVFVAVPTEATISPTLGPNCSRRPEASSCTFQNEADRASAPPPCLVVTIAATELFGGACCVSVVVAVPPLLLSPGTAMPVSVTVACVPLTVPENVIWLRNPGPLSATHP